MPVGRWSRRLAGIRRSSISVGHFIEGLAAAVLLPLTFTVLTVSYEDDDRAKAFGLLAGVNEIGSTLGPIIGGALTTYASWRWGFTLSQLLGVGVILFFVRYVTPNPLSESRVR